MTISINLIRISTPEGPCLSHAWVPRARHIAVVRTFFFNEQIDAFMVSDISQCPVFSRLSVKVKLTWRQFSLLCMTCLQFVNQRIKLIRERTRAEVPVTGLSRSK